MALRADGSLGSFFERAKKSSSTTARSGRCCAALHWRFPQQSSSAWKQCVVLAWRAAAGITRPEGRPTPKRIAGAAWSTISEQARQDPLSTHKIQHHSTTTEGDNPHLPREVMSHTNVTTTTATQEQPNTPRAKAEAQVITAQWHPRKPPQQQQSHHNHHDGTPASSIAMMEMGGWRRQES